MTDRPPPQEIGDLPHAALLSAAIEVMDAGDVLAASLGELLARPCYPAATRRATLAIARWHRANHAFLAITDRELGSP